MGILAQKSIVYITSLHPSVARERGAHAERYRAHLEYDGRTSVRKIASSH
jgi:hypothetical protein